MGSIVDPSTYGSGRARCLDVAVPAALRGREQGGDASHDQVGREPLGGPAVRARGELVGETERGRPTRTVTRPPGCGSFWPRGQTPYDPAIAIGTIGAPDPQRQDRDAVATLAQRPVMACASPPGRRTGHVPRRGSAWPGGTPPRRPCDRSTGWTPPFVAIQPDDRPGEELLLAEPLQPAAQLRHQRGRDDDRVQVGSVVATPR